MTLLLDWPGRARYSENYLTWRVPESQVQKAVLDDLQRRGAVCIAVDAGAAMIRGRIRGALHKIQHEEILPMVMAGRTGAGAKGLPDIVGVLPGGRALFIEVKKPEWCEPSPKNPGKLRQVQPPGAASEEQRAFLQAAYRLGAAAGVVWHWKDLELILR
jgi:hypothetical protein